MAEVPGLFNTETQQTAFPSSGQGGSDVILIMGESDADQDLETIYEIYSYTQAKQILTQETANSKLLSGLYNVFLEGGKYANWQSPTISKVYAIAMGDSPTTGDYEQAMVNSEIKRDIDIELFYQNYNTPSSTTAYIAHMNAVSTHLSTLEESDDYREAGFTLDPTLSIADKLKFTDVAQTSYLRNSRVWIHENANMQGKFAGKVAVTPYYADPAEKPYRSAGISTINEYKYDVLNQFITAGLVCDYRSPALPGQIATVSPVRAVNTSHSYDADGNRPLDTNIQTRRLVDYLWWYSDILALQSLNIQGDDLSRQHILNEVNAFFQSQANAGYLEEQKIAPVDPGYTTDIVRNAIDNNQDDLLRQVRPMGIRYFINISSTIQSAAQLASGTTTVNTTNTYNTVVTTNKTF